MRILRLIAACLLCAPGSSEPRAVRRFLRFVGIPDQGRLYLQFREAGGVAGERFPQPDSPIVIGILGTDPFGTTLDTSWPAKKSMPRASSSNI